MTKLARTMTESALGSAQRISGPCEGSGGVARETARGVARENPSRIAVLVGTSSPTPGGVNDGRNRAELAASPLN